MTMKRTFVAVALAVVAILVASCSGGSKPQATPAVTAVPGASDATAIGVPSPTVPPVDTFDGIRLQPLTLGGDIPLPAGLVVYYNVSGYGKGGGPGELRRAYRDADGQLRVDSLVAPAAARITWQATDFEHGVVAVEICARGLCASGENSAAPGSEARLVTSDDGGISWVDRGLLPDDAFVLAIVPGDIVLGSWRPGEPERYWHFPSGEAITPPAAGFFPAVIQGAGLVWAREGDSSTDIRDWSGAEIASIGRPYASREAPRFVASAIGGDAAFRTIWFTRDIPGATGPGVGGRFVLARLDRDQHATEAYYQDGEYPVPVVAISTTEILGNVSTPGDAGRRFPAALIDLETRVVHPIPELSPANGSTPFVRAALVGTFARVNTGGSCLNVRENPAKLWDSLGCFYDGVLLRLRTAAEQTADGISWVAVETPGGRAGWAAAEFLER